MMAGAAKSQRTAAVPVIAPGAARLSLSTGFCCRGSITCTSKVSAEVLLGLATDTVYLSRREEALKGNRLTFAIRAADSSWHPGLAGCPLSVPHGLLLPGVNNLHIQVVCAD